MDRDIKALFSGYIILSIFICHKSLREIAAWHNSFSQVNLITTMKVNTLDRNQCPIDCCTVLSKHDIHNNQFFKSYRISCLLHIRHIILFFEGQWKWLYLQEIYIYGHINLNRPHIGNKIKTLIVSIRKQGKKCDKCVTNNIYINVCYFITDKKLSNVCYSSWVVAIWCTSRVGNEYNENGISIKRTIYLYFIFVEILKLNILTLYSFGNIYFLQKWK